MLGKMFCKTQECPHYTKVRKQVNQINEVRQYKCDNTSIPKQSHYIWFKKVS